MDSVDLVTAANTTLALGGRVNDLTIGGRMGLGGTAPVSRVIAGDLIFQPGSIYDVRITPDGMADHLQAAGSITIQGGTVNALAGAGTYVDGQSYVILTGAGGVTGTFTGLTTTATAFLNLSLAYAGNQVLLVTERNAVDFDALAQTYNQGQAAIPLMAFGEGDDDVATVYSELLFLQEDQVPAALDAVSGELHASVLGVALRLGRALPQAMADRSRQAITADGMGFWLSGLYLDGGIDGDGNAAKVRHDRAGVVFGVDYNQVDSGLRIGMAGGYSTGDVTVSGRLSEEARAKAFF